MDNAELTPEQQNVQMNKRPRPFLSHAKAYFTRLGKNMLILVPVCPS
jgi:hypothetical protein